MPRRRSTRTRQLNTYTQTVNEDVDEPLIEINDVELTHEWTCIYVDRKDGYIEAPFWTYHDEDCDPDDEEIHQPVYVLIMSPDEARTLGETLIHAAQHGDVQQRKN